MWVLAALTMTVGNLIALRQTNIVRLLAYSGGGPGRVHAGPAGRRRPPAAAAATSLHAVVIYLLIYAAMNLGAFAVVHRRGPQDPQSGEISSWGGLFEYAPGLTVLMTVFLFALAGIPPLGGWFAKFLVFQARCSQPAARPAASRSPSSSP